jgi:Trk-type K+ transport system membrane component
VDTVTLGQAFRRTQPFDAAKWICSATMLLGRLEILAVIVVFSPTFWRG